MIYARHCRILLWSNRKCGILDIAYKRCSSTLESFLSKVFSQKQCATQEQGSVMHWSDTSSPKILFPCLAASLLKLSSGQRITEWVRLEGTTVPSGLNTLHKQRHPRAHHTRSVCITKTSQVFCHYFCKSWARRQGRSMATLLSWHEFPKRAICRRSTFPHL